MPVKLLPLALVVCLAACGGGGDFSGEPDVPGGWETYAEAGVSFAHPGGWDVRRLGEAVEISPPETSQTPYGLIRLSVTQGAGDRFESLADQRRIVIREVNDAEIDSDEPVEIAGAEQALRVATTTPADRGTDPVEVRADSLDVLRVNGDVIVLTAASPQREGGSFDTAAVIESFRLEG